MTSKLQSLKKKMFRSLEQGEGSQWFFADKQKESGVVLLLHGLNQRPSSWNDLISELTASGLHVYRLSFKGHRGLPIVDMQDANAEIWLKEFTEGYNQIATRFPILPRYLIAYSLGGLVAEVGQLEAGKSLFDRQFLLAPALRIRHYTRLVLPLTKIFPLLPSNMAATHYVANIKGTAASAYQALFHLEKRLRSFHDTHVLNIPTRIIIRPHDELVSYRGTVQWVAQKSLDKWKVLPFLPKSLKSSGNRIHHLIIDQKAVGVQDWHWMTRMISGFLKGKRQHKLLH